MSVRLTHAGQQQSLPNKERCSHNKEMGYLARSPRDREIIDKMIAGLGSPHTTRSDHAHPNGKMKATVTLVHICSHEAASGMSLKGFKSFLLRRGL